MESKQLSPLFGRHFPAARGDGAVSKSGTPPLSPPLVALGTLQWGTTPIDSKSNGPRGNLTVQEADEIYQTFRSAGVVIFDTAEGYGGGTSERRLGRLIRQELMQKKDGSEKDPPSKDDGDTVATEEDATGAAEQPSKDDGGRRLEDGLLVMTKFLPVPWRFTHAHFEDALRASNERLGISKCPIYLLHSPMHITREIEYWVESAAICKGKGLLETFGLSNCSAEEVRRAVDAGKKFGVTIAVNQVHYSLLDYGSRALRDMHETCDELGVAVIGYNSLGQGMLTDNFTTEKFERNKPAKMMNISWDELTLLRNALREVADGHSGPGGKQVSMAQVCMSWVRAKGVIPLVGCRSKGQAEDTLASLSLELTDADVAKLDSAALDRCTLDNPKWRRKLFVTLAGVFVALCRLLDFLGFGEERAVV